MNQLYHPLPEVQFPVDELIEWGHRNKDNFRHARDNVANGFFGCILPYRFCKILNDQVKLDTQMYNNNIPVFGIGQMYILGDDYPMHTDNLRDASMNFLLTGESVTMWEGGTVCPYKPYEAMLFNTQVPHGIFPKKDEVPRMAVSFAVTMGFARFMNLHRQNMIFGNRDILMHWTEITPS